MKKIICALLMTMAVSSIAVADTCEQLVGKKMCYKIGQMLIVGFGGLNQSEDGEIRFDDPDGTVFKNDSLLARDIAQAHVGGIIFFTRPWRDAKTQKFIRDRNITGPAQLSQLNNDILSFYKKQVQAQHLPNLPLILSLDEEGGFIERLPAEQGFYKANTLLPQALGEAEKQADNDVTKKQQALDAAYQQALLIAKNLRYYHFNVDFAPVVDVNINPINPIIGGLGRSFSDNPKIVVDQAKIFIKALHQYGIIAALKHFPGHGSSHADSHVGLVDVTDSYQKAKELYPYKQLFKAGYDDLVMTTHVINGQIDRTQCKSGSEDDHGSWCPGTMSQKTLTGLLRKQLGFKGVIVSDDMTMGAIANEYPLEVSLQKAVNAGVNMFIISNNYGNSTLKVEDTLAQLVHDGKIKPAKINAAYQKIVAMKRRLQA